MSAIQPGAQVVVTTDVLPLTPNGSRGVVEAKWDEKNDRWWYVTLTDGPQAGARVALSTSEMAAVPPLVLLAEVAIDGEDGIG